MVKREVRFLGIDDSPFLFSDERTRIVGVVTRGAQYVEGVLSGHVRVDGDDATQRVLEMVGGSRFRPMLRALFLNGVTMGGFNVVDLDALHEGSELPVVALVRREPDLERAAAALRKHVADAEVRASRLSRLRPVKVRNGGHDVWVSVRGIEVALVPALLASATVRGAVPEPVRLAHVIASGIARGESRGPV